MGGAVGSIVGSVGSSLVSSALGGGADSAASDYAGQIGNANAAIQAAMTRSRAAYMPYRQAGLTALNAYADLMGLSRPQGGYEMIEDVYNSHTSPRMDFTNGTGQRGTTLGEQMGVALDMNGNPIPGAPAPDIRPMGNNLGLMGFFATPEYQLLWGNNGAAVDPNASPLDRFMQNPAYQSGIKLANQALEASGAAKGSALSGNQIKAISALNTDLGNQYFNTYQSNLGNTFNNYANRLAAMAGYGMQAANGAAAVDLPSSQALSQNYTNLGDTMANSDLAKANARASGYTNITNSLLGSGVEKFSDFGKGISSFFS